jgi:hypothetical protein
MYTRRQFIQTILSLPAVAVLAGGSNKDENLHNHINGAEYDYVAYDEVGENPYIPADYKERLDAIARECFGGSAGGGKSEMFIKYHNRHFKTKLWKHPE